MSALSAAAQRRVRNLHNWSQNWRAQNSNTFYFGAFCAVPGANALTSSRGYLVEWQNEINLLWAGYIIGSGTNSLSTTNTVVGDTSASPVVEATTECGPFILVQYTVTGVSAQSNVGRTQVYASNDNDLTTTANQAPVVGRVLYWYSSTTADVLMYGLLESWVG